MNNELETELYDDCVSIDPRPRLIYFDIPDSQLNIELMKQLCGSDSGLEAGDINNFS